MDKLKISYSEDNTHVENSYLVDTKERSLKLENEIASLKGRLDEVVGPENSAKIKQYRD